MSEIDWKEHTRRFIQSDEFKDTLKAYALHCKETVVDPFRDAVSKAKSPQEVREALREYYKI